MLELNWITRALIVGIIACLDIVHAPNDANAASEVALRAQLRPVISDPMVLAFIAREASAARVERFHFISEAQLKKTCVGAVYGCAKWDKGRKRGVVYLNAERAGGTGLTNITHEVSHVGAFRKSCFDHGDVWLEYWMGMAQRYEAAFPGSRWGRSKPTSAVQVRYQRYDLFRKRCPTANTPASSGLALRGVTLQVPEQFADYASKQMTVVLRELNAKSGRMDTLYQARLISVGSGAFQLAFSDRKAKNALKTAEFVCITMPVNGPYELADGTLGTCYTPKAPTPANNAVRVSAPNSNGIVAFQYRRFRQR